jgi:hypothetical protein
MPFKMCLNCHGLSYGINVPYVKHKVHFKLLLLLLFTAVGFAPGRSSPTLVRAKTMKQHYAIITTQYNET